ncbi:MAG: hypothetical protein ACREQD_04995, partial [Candidatus Binataceae bacterium]
MVDKPGHFNYLTGYRVTGNQFRLPAGPGFVSGHGEETTMIEHLSFGVKDLARARRFYDAAFKALGYS